MNGENIEDETRRIDRWLWFARFFKSRSLASRFVASGRPRVNGTTVSKAHHPLRLGDVLTFSQGPLIRVVRVTGLGQRRGPAVEARTLYDDLEPPPPRAPRDRPPAPRAGRPTKAGRRAIQRMKEGGQGTGSDL